MLTQVFALKTHSAISQSSLSPVLYCPNDTLCSPQLSLGPQVGTDFKGNTRSNSREGEKSFEENLHYGI